MIDIHLISQCTVEPDVDCLVIPAFEDALNEAAASKLLEKRINQPSLFSSRKGISTVRATSTSLLH